MKYRIVEKMGRFYPQYSKGWIWRSAGAHPVNSYNKFNNKRYYQNLEDANRTLNMVFRYYKRLSELKKKGTLIHAPQLSD